MIPRVPRIPRIPRTSQSPPGCISTFRMRIRPQDSGSDPRVQNPTPGPLTDPILPSVRLHYAVHISPLCRNCTDLSILQFCTVITSHSTLCCTELYTDGLYKIGYDVVLYSSVIGVSVHITVQYWDRTLFLN